MLHVAQRAPQRGAQRLEQRRLCRMRQGLAQLLLLCSEQGEVPRGQGEGQGEALVRSHTKQVRIASPQQNGTRDATHSTAPRQREESGP